MLDIWDNRVSRLVHSYMKHGLSMSKLPCEQTLNSTADDDCCYFPFSHLFSLLGSHSRIEQALLLNRYRISKDRSRTEHAFELTQEELDRRT